MGDMRYAVLALVLVGCATKTVYVPVPAAPPPQQPAMSDYDYCRAILADPQAPPDRRVRCESFMAQVEPRRPNAAAVVLGVLGDGLSQTDDQKAEAREREQARALRDLAAEQKRLADEQRRARRQADAERSRVLFR